MTYPPVQIDDLQVGHHYWVFDEGNPESGWFVVGIGEPAEYVHGEKAILYVGDEYPTPAVSKRPNYRFFGPIPAPTNLVIK